MRGVIMAKGMFVNCWGCHVTTKLDDKTQEWYSLDVIDKGEIICNPSFCSKTHLDSWLKNDLIPLLVQEIFDKAIEEPRKSSSQRFTIGSGAMFASVSGSSFFSQGISPGLRRGKCITCGKEGEFRLELVIYHNNTTERKGFCSLDCLVEINSA